LNDGSKWFRNDEEVKFFGCSRNREWYFFIANKNVQASTHFTKLYFRRKVHFNSIRSQIKKIKNENVKLVNYFPLKKFFTFNIPGNWFLSALDWSSHIPVFSKTNCQPSDRIK
jgi:hypothetical protein